MWNGPDRRNRRSLRMCEAARLQLEKTSARFGVEVLSVADERGLIVAASGADERCEMLAAHAPLLCRRYDSDGRRAVFRSISQEMPRAGLRRISVREFLVDGQPLFLCAIGDRTERKEAALQQAVTGLRRILCA
jgi:hypothetical protein